MGWDVYFVARKLFNSLHFVISVLSKVSQKTREASYSPQARLFLEYGSSYWDPYHKYPIDALREG